MNPDEAKYLDNWGLRREQAIATPDRPPQEEKSEPNE